MRIVAGLVVAGLVVAALLLVSRGPVYPPGEGAGRIVRSRVSPSVITGSAGMPGLGRSPDVLAGSPAADGDVHLSSGDDVLRTIRFNAAVDRWGNTSGDMRFTDPSATPETDPDNPQVPETSSAGLSMDVAFDCAVIVGNRAVMGGVVVDSTFPERLGQRVLLALEDNGQGSTASQNRVAWGIYGNRTRDWTPSDAERKGDPGVGLTWIATDAERDDDVGVPSNRSEVVDCHTFPLGSYSFVPLEQGDGNIRVQH